jgi:hypothetical protein
MAAANIHQNEHVFPSTGLSENYYKELACNNCSVMHKDNIHLNDGKIQQQEHY